MHIKLVNNVFRECALINFNLINLAKLKNALIFTSFIVVLFLLALRAFSETIDTCAQYQSVTVGSYIVQTGYWHKDLCKGTQCLSIDNQTGAFTVTKGDYNCPDNFNIAAYPDILYGCAYGNCSPHSDLPAQISSLNCVNTNWSFQSTNTGTWDAAYDIWICPDNTCGSTGFNGGAEVMIWLDYTSAGSWQYDMGPVTVDGMTWEVWQFDSSYGTDKHKYVAYLAKTKTTSIQNLDIKPFLNDCQVRGYVKPSWYLYAIEAGNEINSGGIPFTSKSFSVSVNKDCGETPIEDYRLAYQLYQQRQFAQAVSAYHKVVQEKPDYWQAYQGLGIALIKTGDQKAALQALHKSLKLNPNNPPVKAAVEKMEAGSH